MRRGVIRKDKRHIGFPKKSPSLESNLSLFTTTTKGARRVSSAEHIGQDLISHQYGPNLFDCCSILIYCPRHNYFGLSRINESKGFWLPYVPIKYTGGWYATCCNKLKQLLAVAGCNKSYLSFSQPELIHVFRLQVPSLCQFVTRVTFLTQLIIDEKSGTSCCVACKGNISWFSADDVINQNIADLWGPEPSVFGEAFTHNAIEKGAYTEYTLRDAMRYMPREPPKTFQDEMLKSANFQEKDITRLYSEFIQHCYPSQYMVFPSFVDYLCKLGWTTTDPELEHIYRAFGFNRLAYLSFHEFLLGLAAMDKQTHHGGHSGELRCGYIFRYYDINNDSTLNNQDMARMTYDILRLKNKPHDEESVEKELIKNYASLSVNINEPITETQFLRAIGSMTFRGSSALFRSPYPILSSLHIKPYYGSLSNIDIEKENKPTRKAKGTCPNCKNKNYTLAIHSIRINSDGHAIDPIEFLQEDTGIVPKDRVSHSLTSFSSESAANRILEWLRDYTNYANLGLFKRATGVGSKKITPDKSKLQNFWLNGDRQYVTNMILKLCADVELIFKKELRCLKLNSPCYVLGDTHGNFRDLMIYERILWRTSPFCPSSNYLFLGDIVDRGEYGLECICYLFACKIISPERFWLIRGNHELRTIQTVFTFQKECLEKFGRNLGHSIWETINRAFDHMPICAIVDESIFCAHGGIPTSLLKIEELQNIPVPLPEPESQCPAAWEILWNDPVSGTEFDEYAEILRLQSGNTALNSLQGFLPNTKRGTAYYFNEEAVNRFLKANGLTHIIRAHEVVAPGYRFHMNGKVITIFSSSHYCGGSNESACILIEQEKLRVLRLDTTS